MDALRPRVETRWIFEGPVVQISRWQCRAADDRRNAERAQARHVITFIHSGNFHVSSSGETGLLDCTRVGFFNARIPFRSRHLYSWRDRGSELAVEPRVLAEIVAQYDPSAGDRQDHPFSMGSGPCSLGAFLLQRILVHRASSAEVGCGLEVEELALALADRVVRASFRERASVRERPLRAREREEAERLRGHLSARPGDPHRLDELARLVGSTPFRLCRTFRKATGTTIHRHLTRIRLQQAIDRLADGSPDLSDLAFDLGFSSHSHFSAAFRKGLGVAPEAIRRAARGRNIGQEIGSLRRLPETFEGSIA